MKKKTRATAAKAGKGRKSAAAGRKAAPRRSSAPAIPAAGGIQRQPKRRFAGCRRNWPRTQAQIEELAGLRRYRLPAGHSQPARLRARTQSRDRLHQTLSRQRRADRARRRSPEADQRRLRTRRRRSGAEGRSSATLLAQVRSSDVVGRLGGDEFALLLWNLSETDARAKAAALEEAIDRLTFVFRGQHHHRGRLRRRRDSRYRMRKPAARWKQADSAMYVRKAQRRHETS